MEHFMREYDDIVFKYILDAEVFNGSKSKKVKALIDTGCDNTCISPEIVSELGLEIKDKKDMRDASNNVHHSNVYYVGIVIENSIHLPVGKAVDFLFETKEFDVLIGTDILCDCDFIVTNTNGRTKIAMVYPSSLEI